MAYCFVCFTFFLLQTGSSISKTCSCSTSLACYVFGLISLDIERYCLKKLTYLMVYCFVCFTCFLLQTGSSISKTCSCSPSLACYVFGLFSLDIERYCLKKLTYLMVYRFVCFTCFLLQTGSSILRQHTPFSIPFAICWWRTQCRYLEVLLKPRQVKMTTFRSPGLERM